MEGTIWIFQYVTILSHKNVTFSHSPWYLVNYMWLITKIFTWFHFIFCCSLSLEVKNNCYSLGKPNWHLLWKYLEWAADEHTDKTHSSSVPDPEHFHSHHFYTLFPASNWFCVFRLVNFTDLVVLTILPPPPSRRCIWRWLLIIIFNFQP